MARRLTFRQLLISILALRKDLSHKELGARAGLPQKRVSLYLRRGELSDENYERLLGALRCLPGEIEAVTACLESLEALEALELETNLTPEERTEIEDTVLRAGRFLRTELAEAVRLSRIVPAEGYPEAHDLAPARKRAGELFKRLKGLPEEARLAMVHVAGEYQGWALCERLCEASVREASRDLEEAAAWARLARKIAERIQGPEVWRDRLQGYAAAHGANVLRVSGDLKAADAVMEEAKRLWHGGADLAGVLDPGRLLDLEASLRRAQRRFPEALALLDEAAAVGRNPGRTLVKKGHTLEVLGEYERAVETLLRAAALVRQKEDRRLETILDCNLALNYCHLGQFAEAEELAGRVRAAATEGGDTIGVVRVTWIQGRVAAGLGRSGEARSLLAQARREFAAQDMDYDVALALLEEAALLLEEGQASKVTELARKLAVVFESKGVHREALAALGLFQEAAENEEATVELTRRVLGYLFRARYDPDLRFES